MNSSIIYFDNAATTFPKPEEVYVALDAHVRRTGNSGRGAHSLSMSGARTIFETRELAADFLGLKSSERLIFTPGCTYSLNMVLRSLCSGTGSNNFDKNSLVLISGLEHNAVMRPLHKLQSVAGFAIKALPYSPGQFCNLQILEEQLRELKPALFILTEGSNVTGEIADCAAVAALCKQFSVPLLVDAAQTAGRFPKCLASDGISFWCASAHKGLMGPQGLGLLYVNPEFALEPFVYGGTGSASEQLDMPDVYPDHLEAGTMPAFLIAGLGAGVKWIQSTGVGRIIEWENSLVERFTSWADTATLLKLHGRRPGANKLNDKLTNGRANIHLPLLSFEVDGKSSEQVADLLQRDANIAVRSGLHCSVQAHRALGSETTGLVRVSFGFFNTFEQIDQLCLQLSKIGASSEH